MNTKLLFPFFFAFVACATTVTLDDRATQLTARAAEAEPAVTTMLVALAEQLGGEMYKLEYRLKSFDSTRRKLNKKLQHDPSRSIAELELDDIAPAKSSRRSSSTRAGRGAAAPAAPAIKRTSAVAAAVAEEVEEPGWVKGLAILTALLLLLSAPVLVSLATGNASGAAKGIAGLFGNTFEEPSTSAAADQAP